MKTVRLLVAAFLLMPSASMAQTPSRIVRVGGAHTTVDNARFERYATLYFSGDLAVLDSILRSDLKSLTVDTPAVKLLDVRNAFVSVAFAATPPTQKDATIIRVVLLPKHGLADLPVVLPGVSSVFEVVLLTEAQATFGTSWISTRQANPNIAQLGKFVDAALPGAAGLIGVLSSKGLPDPGKPVSNNVFAVINRVDIPDRRAVIQVTTRIVDVDLPLNKTKTKSIALVKELNRGTSRLSPCASMLADSLNTFVQTNGATGTSEQRTATADGIKAQASAILALDRCNVEAGDAGSLTELTKARNDAVMDVIAKFVSLVNPTAEPVSATTEVKNVPFEHWSFGLMGAGMIHKSGDVAVEVSEGVIVPKTVGGLVTAAEVHFHPWRYNPSSQHLTPAESFSLSVGFVTTPAPGLLGGVAIEFMRGVGVQASYAAMLVDRLRPEYELGKTVTKLEDPTRAGMLRAFTLGISYSFK